MIGLEKSFLMMYSNLFPLFSWDSPFKLNLLNKFGNFLLFWRHTVAIWNQYLSSKLISTGTGFWSHINLCNLIKIIGTCLNPQISCRQKIEKMKNMWKAKLTDEDIDEGLLYAVMKNYVLTTQQLEDNGYPLPDPQVSRVADPVHFRPDPENPNFENRIRILLALIHNQFKHVKFFFISIRFLHIFLCLLFLSKRIEKISRKFEKAKNFTNFVTLLVYRYNFA